MLDSKLSTLSNGTMLLLTKKRNLSNRNHSLEILHMERSVQCDIDFDNGARLIDFKCVHTNGEQLLFVTVQIDSNGKTEGGENE